MSIVTSSARAGAAAFVLGLALAGPNAVGAALADTGDTDPASISTGQDGAAGPGGQSPSKSTLGRAGRNAKPPTVSTSSAQTASSRGVKESAKLSVANAAASEGFSPLLPPRPDSALDTAAATLAPAPVASSRTGRGFSVARVPAAAERSVPTPVEVGLPPGAAASGVVVKPAAAGTTVAQVGQSPVGGVDSIRRAVADFLDGSLNWLNGLPSNSFTNFLSGALLLLRRDVEATVVNLNQVPARLVSNVSADRTYVVSTLADSGAGSLRQAILDANAAVGTDQITFSVAGTVQVGDTALPAITGTTVVDGTTAPGYSTKPVVRIDFQNTAGLTLAAGATGSQISGLSLVDAAGAGVTIAASGTTLSSNYIGLWGNGSTVEGNRGDGVLVQAGASGNLIGIGSTTAYALSNVISGNGGNGITILGDGNVVQANYIGTDAAGNRERANRGNGIQITSGAAGNTIGGTATNTNSPTEGIFARPPMGNVISGNRGNGVLIDNGAEQNQLSGNFIGTTYSGNAALGNRGDGVAIADADRNSLVGTTSLQPPFVYYNVISGNCGNGLRITDSDNTIVHANFFGLAADNATPVANGGDGLLVNGTSQRVDIGGQIPLGNVMSGNRRYGIEIADTAGGVTSFNSFVGQVAFGGAAPNGAGGIMVTSSNPGFDLSDELTWIRIRTSLIGGNRGNGIEFAGNAHGAEVTDTAVGTNYKIEEALPNLGSGIVVGGNSSQIAIGGFQPSIQQADGQFSVHVGSNTGWGIVFKDNARDSLVFDTRVGIGVGLTVSAAYPLPNGSGGILIGPGTSGIVIGGPRDALDPGKRFYNEIVGNDGDGVTARYTSGLKLLGNTIAGNSGNGVVLMGVRDAVVGERLAGNYIIDNRRNGLLATGNLAGSAVQASTISGNDGSGVRLSWARGITVGGTQGTDLNEIVNNGDWGILATGWSRGSALTGNIVSGNAPGDIKTTFSTLPSPTVAINQIFQQTGTPSLVGTLITGVRGAGGNNVALTFGVIPAGQPDPPLPQAALYYGPLNDVATATPVILTPRFSGQTVTSATFYGPNTHQFNPRLIPEGQVQAVGNYTNTISKFQQGMIYLGPPNNSGGTWTPINVPSSGSGVVGGVSACEGRSPSCSVASTIPHSTMGDLVVGNYDLTTPDGQDQDPTTVNAFIYNTATKKYTLLGSNGDPFGALNNYTTVYGVWQNGGQDSSLYTLAGGTGKPGLDAGEKGFLVTYDASTGRFGTPSYYSAQDAGVNTHFEGITPTLGGFALAGETLSSRGLAKVAAFVPTSVPLLPFAQNVDSIRYGSAIWAAVDVDESKLCPTGCVLTTSNTIYENNLFGVFDAGQGSGIQTYQATLTGRFGLLPLWYL